MNAGMKTNQESLLFFLLAFYINEQDYLHMH